MTLLETVLIILTTTTSITLSQSCPSPSLPLAASFTPVYSDGEGTDMTGGASAVRDNAEVV